MVLRAGYLAVAQKLQEAAFAMSHKDIRTRLADCLNDAFRGTGNWCYVVAVFGDDASGDVVYSCNSDLKKAVYTIASGVTKIATATAVDVQPLTTYEVESVEAKEAGARNSRRDLTQLQTIHDSAAALGANCSLAESGGGSEIKEHSAQAGQSTGIKLVESAACLETIVIREAKADYEIKLIAPGKGSSAFYPAEVLKRDGPTVFGAGTHVYLNHPTKAEEVARPEGDVKNLAGVLTSAAVYHESHAKGPGLYGRMKVFADHGTLVEEKAAHVGMSIRANGEAVMEGKRPVMKEGVPVLSALTSAESVDVVTRAGAGGMILTEAAGVPRMPRCGGKCGDVECEEAADHYRKHNSKQESDMDQAEVQKLIESAVKSAQAPLLERAIRGDARELMTGILKPLTLHESGKDLVADSVLRDIPMKDGALDVAKFTEIVNESAKRIGAAFAAATGAGQVRGMGVTTPVRMTEDARKRQADELADIQAIESDVFGRLAGSAEVGKKVAAREVRQ